MSMKFYASFGQEVRTQRKKLNLTQQDLADRIGVNRRTIVKIETGRSETRHHLALSLCDTLGISVQSQVEKLRTTRGDYKDAIGILVENATDELNDVIDRTTQSPAN